MRISGRSFQKGNVLLCVLCTILVVSVIGGNVLLNCMTRYNAAASQVRSWKESLDAAETGGDIAYAEIRKTIVDPSHAFSASAKAKIEAKGGTCEIVGAKKPQA